MQVNGFRQADAALQGRSSARRKLANNTYLERRGDGSIAVKLYETDVVTYHPDESLVFNSGGWLTATTKDRMNEYGKSGYRIYSVRGVWYVGKDGSWEPDKAMPYKGGLTFHADGTVTGAGERSDADAIKALRKAIRKYADLCAAAVPLPKPGHGDCWYCLMRTEDGKSLGDAVKDVEHLQSHIDEDYVVPSLVWSALVEAGYDPQRQIIHALAFGEPGNMADTARDAVKRSVVKYMVRRMIRA